MSDEQIRHRLRRQGYRSLAAEPEGPARLRAAAEHEALAVWTDHHLLTIDDSNLDPRPS